MSDEEHGRALRPLYRHVEGDVADLDFRHISPPNPGAGKRRALHELCLASGGTSRNIRAVRRARISALDFIALSKT